MDRSAVRGLQFLTLQLVGAVAVVHLVVGGDQLLSIAANGLLDEYVGGRFFSHPRAGLFVTSGVAILGGIVATARGHLDRRVAYQLGVGLLVCYLFGWVAWHTVLDHGAALGSAPSSGGESGSHHSGILDTIYSHYVAPLVATLTASTTGTPGTGKVLLGVVSKSLELVAVACLLVLLRVDPEAQGESLVALFAAYARE